MFFWIMYSMNNGKTIYCSIFVFVFMLLGLRTFLFLLPFFFLDKESII